MAENAHKYLEKLSIYELRLYGRELGVQKPTTMKKKDLIESIIKIGANRGQVAEKNNRGAHPKARIVSEQDLKKLDNLLKQPNVLSEEIKIMLSPKELNLLVQFAFIGNFVINGIRLPQNCLQEYANLTEKIYKICIKTKPGNQNSDKIENDLADLQDRIYDSVSAYMEEYEKDVYLEKIAKRVTDINYPLNGYDENALFLNFRAEEVYIKLLKENGDAYVHMEAPRIDDILHK